MPAESATYNLLRPNTACVIVLLDELIDLPTTFANSDTTIMHCRASFQTVVKIRFIQSHAIQCQKYRHTQIERYFINNTLVLYSMGL